MKNIRTGKQPGTTDVMRRNSLAEHVGTRRNTSERAERAERQNMMTSALAFGVHVVCMMLRHSGTT